MTSTTNDFVVGLTSGFWATIYRKRKTARNDVDDRFDMAADINQESKFDLYDQDQVVKQHFRELVEYIIKVIFLYLVIPESTTKNFFRESSKEKSCF